MKNTILFIAVLLSGRVSAQQFQWIKGGGTAMTLTRDEKTDFICADASGNVYAASTVGGTSVHADTFYRTQLHNPSGKSTLLTSYNCEGTMRWAVPIEEGYCYGLKYYNGNIYVAGVLGGQRASRYIGNTLITGHDYQNYFLAKLDTFGSLKWVQFVEPNTFTNYPEGSYYGALEIDGQGNIHHFTQIGTSGKQLSPTVVSQAGTYDVSYDASGNLVNVVRLGVSVSYGLRDDYGFVGKNNSVAIDKRSGKIYAAMTLNDLAHSHTSRLCAFSPAGVLLWEDTATWGAFPERSVLWNVFYDGHNGIYAAGTGSNGKFGFIGAPVVYNTSYPGANLSVIVKVDTNGNTKWISANNHSGNIGDLAFTSQLPNGNIIAAGTTSGNITHGSTTLAATRGGQNPFYMIVDTAGMLVRMDTLYGNSTEYFTAMTTDLSGNVYFGGLVTDSIRITGGKHYKSGGGPSDFFVTKLGYNCGCSTVAIAGFTSSMPVGKTVTYTYTGSTPADSIIWNFGDGQRLKLTAGFTTPVTHTYAANNYYNVCVTVFSGCGNNTFCKLAPLAVNAATVPDSFSVHPNPATNYLRIEGVSSGVIMLSNAIGQKVRTRSAENSSQDIFIGDLQPGIYMLSITTPDGARKTIRVIKL